MVAALESLAGLNAEQLRELASDLIGQIAHQSKQHEHQIAAKDQVIASKNSDILHRANNPNAQPFPQPFPQNYPA